MLRNWLTKLQSLVRTPSRRNSSWKRPARRQVGRFISPPAAQVLEDRTLLSSVSIDDVSLSEGNSGTTNATFTVTLDSDVAGGVTVDFATADDTAVASGSSISGGNDYESNSGQLTFAGTAGETQSITVAINGDNTFELDETFFVNLSNATNGVTISDGQGVGTIQNDDPMPTLTIPDASAEEGDDMVFSFTLSNPSSQEVTVTVNTTSGTATSDVDYNQINSFVVLTFGPGETQQSLAVQTFEDATFEADEDFFLNVIGSTNVNVPDNQAVGTIQNDDPMPTLTIPDASAEEGDDMVFSFTLSNPSSQEITVTVNTTSGSASGDVDYNQINSFVVLTFGPGETQQTLAVQTFEDATFEADEDFFLNVIGSTNVNVPDDQAIGTILNDDGPPIVDGDTTPGEENDDFVVFREGIDIVVLRDGVEVFRAQRDALELLTINGLNGDDTLTIDNSNGLLDIPNGIDFDGGTGFDSLILTGSTAVDSSTYTVGNTNDAGTVAHVLNGATQTINFTGLEPVLDTVAAATLTVNATNADNAINYTQGSVAANGLVSVDGFETIEFSNKTNLVINAGAGSDTINLNNPATPTALAGITVDGGDPTASDTVIVNGTAGEDAIIYTPLTDDSGTVSGAQPVPVAITGAESLIINGQGSTGLSGDDLTIALSAADELILYSLDPNQPAPDGGLVAIFRLGTDLLPLAFRNLRADGSVTFADASGADDDQLIVLGTSLSDEFAVSATGTVVLNGVLPVGQGNIENLLLVGENGDDEFAIAGNHPYAEIVVDGGNPSASDELNFVGTGGAITIDLEAESITEAGFGPVGFTGVEIITVDAAGANVSFDATAADDDIIVSPTGADSVNVSLAGINTVFEISDIGEFDVDGNGGTNDELTVRATTGDDAITADGTTVAVAGLETVNFANFNTINLAGLAGDDVFDVVGRDDGSLTVNVDGGLPDGSDTLRFDVTTGNDSYTVTPGASNHDGVVLAGLDGTATPTTVNFTNIEAIDIDQLNLHTNSGDDGNDAVTLNGTGGDDVFSLAAFDNDEGRAQVNGGPTIRFNELVGNFGAGTGVLTINGFGGDDVLAADHGAAVAGWQFTSVVFNAGPPSASDSFQLLLSDSDDALVYTATGANSGTLDVTTGGFTTTYTLNNVESANVDADGGAADSLNVATANATITPGGTPGTGTVDPVDAGGNALLSLSYAGIETAVVTGTTAVIQGTSENDTITVSATGIVTVTNLLGFNNSVDVSGFDALVINALGGDDGISIEGSALFASGISVIGGEPGAGSDVLNLTGATGPVQLDLATQTAAGFVGPVSYDGIETLNLDAGGNDVTVLGTAGDDDITVTPGAADDAVFTSAGINTVFNVTDVGVLSFDGNGGTNDELTVRATTGNDAITADGTMVAIVGLETVNFTDFDALSLDGREGADDFTVTAAAGLPIFVDGGDPIGIVGGSGDSLTVTNATAFQAGPEADEGTFFAGANSPVSFDHIEELGAIVGGTPLILGTNGDDDITIIARDASTHAGADGVRDFTVSVNGGPALLFLDVAELFVDALAGDDDIVLRTPAPNGAEWDVDVTIVGGAPSAATGSQGDVFELETPGNDDVVFTSTGSDTGTFLIDEATNDSLISIVSQFTLTMAVHGVDYVSEQGGVELAVYDGEGTDDLTVVTPAGFHLINFTPGADATQASIGIRSSAGSLLGVDYVNFDPVGGSLTFSDAAGERSDELNFFGTSKDDLVSVDANGNIQLRQQADFEPLQAPLNIATPGIASLILVGLDGDDTFDVAGNHPFPGITGEGLKVEGGNPSASDVLNFTGAGGDVTVDLQAGTVQEAGFGAVALTGIETLNVNAGAGAINVVGQTIAETLDVTPTGIDTAAIVASGLNLVVNTSNTGTLTIDTAGGSDTVVVNGTAAADTIGVVRGATTTVQVNVLKQVGILTPLVNSDALVVNAGLGNDLIDVSGSAGPQSLAVDGGVSAPSDTLTIANSITGTTTVTTGSTPDSGVITSNDGGVSFAGIELISITGAAATDNITFQGTHDNDTIALQRLGGANRVWLNDGPVISFASFDDVTLQGRFGDDFFSVHPDGLVGVATITVSGGDPTASDTVVVNGTAAADTITYTPTAADAGTVAVNAAPLVSLTTVEHVTINGLGGDDDLIVEGPASSTTTLTPGATPDSGSVQVDSLLPMAFTNLGDGVNVVQINAADGSLVYRGTDGDDLFQVRSGTPATDGRVLLNQQLTVETAGVASLTLEGLSGDDDFNISGTLPPPYTSITASGGDPSGAGSDEVNFTGDGTAIAVSSNVATTTVSGGGLAGLLSLVGVETLFVSANTGDLTYGTLSGGNDSVTVSHVAGPIVRIESAETPVVVRVFDVGTFTVDMDAGDDTLTVNASNQSDTINADGSMVDVVGFETVNFVDVEALRIVAGEGQDTINVTASAIPVFVDGGDPIGVLPGDTLIVGGVGAVTLFGGPENDEGGVQVGTNAPVSFDHIESLTIIGGPPVVVMGTNGNDVITIIARDASTHAGADGVQDFTVSVNAGPDVLFLDTPAIAVNALSGNDEIVVIAPAPNGAVWDVDVTIDGGAPPAGSDKVVVGTPGTDEVIFTVIDTDSATLEIVNIASFIVIDNVELTVYDGGAGGDDVTVVGTGGIPVDYLHTPGTATDAGRVDSEQDDVTGAPFMPFEYVDLGDGTLTLAVNGNGDVTALGTALNDVFVVNELVGDQAQITHTVEPFLGFERVPIIVDNIGVFSAVVVDGLAGDDDITWNLGPDGEPSLFVTARGGSGNDVFTIVGAAGVDDDFTLFPGLPGDPGGYVIARGGFSIASGDGYTGVEVVEVIGNAGDNDTLTANGTVADDTITYRPTGLNTGEFSFEGGSTLFRFNVPGEFTIDGLSGAADRVILVGTNNHDVITIDSPARTAIVQNAAGVDLKQVTLGATVEILTAQGLLGNDTFIVIPAPPVGAGLLVDVDGGLPGSSDTLVIGSDALGSVLPATDFAVVAPGLNPGEGRIRVFRNALPMPDISYSGVEIVFANAAIGTNGDPQRLIFGPDPYEPNDSRTNAAHIGAGETLNGDNLSIFSATTENFPPFLPLADADWFQFVAAETGVLDFQIFFELFDAALLPGGGNLNIEIRDSNGDLIGAGAALLDSNGISIGERISAPVVRNQTYFLRVFGAPQGVGLPPAVNAYEITVINVPAPVPQTIDLQAASDSGRHDSDDVTNVALATFDIILNDDRFDEFTNFNLLPDTVNDDIQTAGFDYGVQVFNNGASIGFAFYTGVGNTWQFTAGPGDLLEGHNNFLTAAVWVRDRATPTVVGTSDQQGPINALQITLDTIAPAAPTITLDPPSDTGVPGFPGTFVDRITSDTTPGFVGNAEADAIVRVFGDMNALGLTVAIPLDGDEAFPNGEWDIEPNLDLNAPPFLVRDGLRIITATAEDLAGNVGEEGRLDIFIDTQGPQVFDPDNGGPQQPIQVVTLGVPNETFDLFDIKPTAGPTPRVDGLLINIQDNPERDPAFLFDALLEILAENPDLFRVVGDRVGVVPIVSVDVTLNPPVAGQPATATIQLNFAEPLEDDRFTLTIFELLTDPAGNLFDGESNALLPLGTPLFPSGNAIPGVSFGARFTVDSRPEVGVHGQVGVTIDANQNFHLDPTVTGGVNIDITRDLIFQFGLQTDAIFAGQFHPNGGVSNGFDRLGAYGLEGGVFRFLLDFNDDGVPDISFASSAQVNALPLAGDFNNDGLGDEIGLFDGVNWYLDTTGDFNLDTVFAGNMRGLPFAGDFDGDGLTDLGTFIANSNSFQFDLAWDGIDGNADQGFGFGFPGVLERPFAGDFNLDGVDDVGLTTPSQTGTDGPLEWYILISTGTPVAGNVNTLDHPFSPTPVGADFAGHFGSGQQVPVVGNFDPPLDVAVDAPADISGEYMFNGKTTQVVQSGSSLTFINENGGQSSGFFLNSTQVIATNWGNLVGNLVDGAIQWQNGSTWTRFSANIAGEYSFNGQSTFVEQSGNELTFINENGGMSQGRFLNATQVVATNWGNLVGNLVNGNIQWTNGSVWTLGAPATQQFPFIAGTYSFAGQFTTVQQNGDSLVFINEHGGSSQGHFLSPTQVVATQWGNLVGNVVGNQIVWANGTKWTLFASAISGEYSIDGQSAFVEQSGNDLTFINENGGSSRGSFLSASQVVASDWGGLIGIVVNGRIEWANGSVWESVALDNLFAAFDDWDLAA